MGFMNKTLVLLVLLSANLFCLCPPLFAKDQDRLNEEIRSTRIALEKLIASVLDASPENKEMELLNRFGEKTPGALDCFFDFLPWRMNSCFELTQNFSVINPLRLEVFEAYEDRIFENRSRFNSQLKKTRNLLKNSKKDLEFFELFIDPLLKLYSKATNQLFYKYRFTLQAYQESSHSTPAWDSTNQETPWTLIFRRHRRLCRGILNLKDAYGEILKNLLRESEKTLPGIFPS